MSLPYWIFPLIALAWLTGCGSEEVKKEPPPPPPPPTRVELIIKADPDINPDAQNRASPLLLRVYELKDLGSFNAADFFALYGKDRETLGGDLVRKQEFTLVPNDTKNLGFDVDASAKFLAVFAAFRDLEAARWRASTDIPPAQTTVIAIQASGTQITLSTAQKPARQNPGGVENAEGKQ